MNTSQLIQAKFQAWAFRHGIQLQGSKGERGEKNYTMSVETNVFGGVLAEEVRESFVAGAGGELKGPICPLQAMHSSAALAVNVFQYWLKCRDFGSLANLLEIPSKNIEQISFEKQLPVCDNPANYGFDRSPHLDVCFDYKLGARVGIECKLHEPFGRKDSSLLSNAYLKLSEPWSDIPQWKGLAKKLTTSNLGFERLGAPQLIKHALGLKFGRQAQDVRLIYFYFDASGRENGEHLNEISRFSELIAGDPIRFQPISIQEFISKACKKLGGSHEEYIHYLSDRYF